LGKGYGVAISKHAKLLFFLAASMVMLSSIFVETGPFSGGWTAYPPLSALVQHRLVLKQVWTFG
jgi:heme/copper-type cytochrome/quinol oxidase subunit 1